MSNFNKDTEHSHIEKIRQSLPAVQKIVYMNTGTMGPLPLRTFEAILKTQQEEVYNGRIGVNMDELVKKKEKARNGARESIARLINAEVEEIALTANTSEGINHIINGFNWKKGDEVLTIDIGLEHVAMLLPLYAILKRYEVDVKIARISIGENPLKALKEQISSKTRLIAISHVFFSTGQLLPIEEIIQFAHLKGIPVLVDGAQAVGAIPVDVKEINVDFYSLPCQKWLCGPEGTGAIFIKKGMLNELSQTYIGYNSIEILGPPDFFRIHSNARRFEVGSTYLPSIIGQKCSIDWLLDEVGLKWIYKRVGDLYHIARKELSTLPGVKIVTPDRAAGLLSFRVEGIASNKLVEHLGAKGIVVRSILEMDCVRASLGFFNTENEIEQLVKGVLEVIKNKEVDVPVRYSHEVLRTTLRDKFSAG